MNPPVVDQTPDPEMLKQLELLLDMDVVEAEGDWETLSATENIEEGEDK